MAIRLVDSSVEVSLPLPRVVPPGKFQSGAGLQLREAGERPCTIRGAVR